MAADADPMHDEVVVRHPNRPLDKVREEASRTLDALEDAAADYYRLRGRAGDENAAGRMREHTQVAAARQVTIEVMPDVDRLDAFADEIRADARTFRRRTAELAAAWDEAERDPEFLSSALT